MVGGGPLSGDKVMSVILMNGVVLVSCVHVGS
jgi:hypothetical protein